jgi:heme exporter protein CcmD
MDWSMFIRTVVVPLMEMDGHGVYVWSAWLIVLTGLWLLAWLPARAMSKLLRHIGIK